MLARDAIGLLDGLKIPRVHFVGLSLGGMIAQHLAVHFPDRLSSLTLCDTTSVMPGEAQPVWQERVALARREGMQALVEDTLERWFTPAFRDKRPAVVDLIRRIYLSTPVAGFTGCCEAIRRLDFAGRLGGVRLPTLVMVGADDAGTPVSASEAIANEIPGSRLRVIPSAAHLSNIEQAEVFNRHLRDFLPRPT
jgi:3-oxoadipate enol-lactonase